MLEAQQLVGAARRCSDPSQALDHVLRALPILEQTLLPGLDRPWIEAKRRHLADLWVDATEILAWASLELDDLTSAESAARALVERAPLHESGYQLLMLAMSKRSNVPDALQVYEALRTVLREELGTSPGAKLRDLHAQLLLDRSDAPAWRPVALTAQNCAGSPAPWPHPDTTGSTLFATIPRSASSSA